MPILRVEASQLPSRRSTSLTSVCELLEGQVPDGSPVDVRTTMTCDGWRPTAAGFIWLQTYPQPVRPRMGDFRG